MVLDGGSGGTLGLCVCVFVCLCVEGGEVGGGDVGGDGGDGWQLPVVNIRLSKVHKFIELLLTPPETCDELTCPLLPRENRITSTVPNYS